MGASTTTSATAEERDSTEGWRQAEVPSLGPSPMRYMRRALHNHQRDELRMFELSRRTCVFQFHSRQARSRGANSVGSYPRRLVEARPRSPNGKGNAGLLRRPDAEHANTC